MWRPGQCPDRRSGRCEGCTRALLGESLATSTRATRHSTRTYNYETGSDSRPLTAWCLLVRKRIRYCGRIARRKPPVLIALLQSRPNGSPLPCVVQLTNDLAQLQKTCTALENMPPPSTLPPACGSTE